MSLYYTGSKYLWTVQFIRSKTIEPAVQPVLNSWTNEPLNRWSHRFDVRSDLITMPQTRPSRHIYTAAAAPSLVAVRGKTTEKLLFPAGAVLERGRVGVSRQCVHRSGCMHQWGLYISSKTWFSRSWWVNSTAEEPSGSDDASVLGRCPRYTI
jgi:hypothetical protein